MFSLSAASPGSLAVSQPTTIKCQMLLYTIKWELTNWARFCHCGLGHQWLLMPYFVLLVNQVPAPVTWGCKISSWTATLVDVVTLGHWLAIEGHSSTFKLFYPTGGQWPPYRGHDVVKLYQSEVMYAPLMLYMMLLMWVVTSAAWLGFLETNESDKMATWVFKTSLLSWWFSLRCNNG